MPDSSSVHIGTFTATTRSTLGDARCRQMSYAVLAASRRTLDSGWPLLTLGREVDPDLELNASAHQLERERQLPGFAEGSVERGARAELPAVASDQHVAGLDSGCCR